MTSIMTREQAQALRTAHDTDAKLLSRKPKYELAAIERSEMAAVGRERIFGGMSKDELIASILALRGFGIERLNEAIHVLHHDVTWPDCQWCPAEDAKHVGEQWPPGNGWPPAAADIRAAILARESTHGALDDPPRELPWLGDIDRRADDDVEFCDESDYA